jgi:periplasmic protein CpxP/Spy
MRRFKALFLIALVEGCLSLPAWAQPLVTMGAAPVGGNGVFIYRSTAGGFPPMPPMPPMIIPPLLTGMQVAHLTADQQNHVDTILQSNASQTAPLIQQLQSVHEQIANKLLSPGTVSASDLTPLEEQAAQLDSEIQQQALNASVQIRAILTPDQVARMAQFHQKMAALQAQMNNLMHEASQQSTPDPAPR